MKKRYQITKLRAAERFKQWAAASSEPIQFAFPTSDIVQLASQSLGELLRSVGKLFIKPLWPLKSRNSSASARCPTPAAALTAGAAKIFGAKQK